MSSDPPLGHVLISGGLGGALGDSIMYPLDTMKTIQQGSSPALVAQKYRTTSQALNTVLKEEGLRRGLFKGYSAMLSGSFPSTMLFFGSYELFKRAMSSNTNLNPTLIHLTSGFLGDFVSSVVYVPSEVIKTRLQLQPTSNNTMKYNYKGLSDAIRQICKYESPTALFHGYKATLQRDLPFSAFQFAFYEKFRSISPRNKVGRISVEMEILSGAAAGGLAGILTTPLDVIKTRIQTKSGEPIRGMTRGLISLYQKEGVTGIMGGVGPRFVWTSVQSSIMLLIYQATLNVLADN